MDRGPHLVDALAMKQEWIFAVVPWLWAVPVLAVLAFALWRMWRRLAARRIARFVSEKRFAALLPAVYWRGHAWSFGITAAVLALLAVALARPMYGPLPDYAESKGVDFVVALDVSKSMWVEDVEPNRLQAVKKELSEWITHMAGDRMGLILFAGDAFVQAPITFDYKALDYVLQQSGPKSISLGGTNIPRALEMASHILQTTDPGLRFLVIISDGENLEGDAVGAVRAARAKDGITVFTVGVGTLSGGRVPSVDAHDPALKKEPAARKAFVNNEYGLGVTSRLDSRALRMLAEAGGGRYYEFRPGMKTFDSLRNQSLLPMAQKNRGINVREYREWFQIPLGCAILLLVLQALIPLVKKRANGKSSGVDVVTPDTLSKSSGPRTMIRARKAAVARMAAGASLVFILGSMARADAPVTAPVEEAGRLLAAGKKEEAVDFMRGEVQKDEKNPWLFYNYALTLYRAERFDESVNVFQALRQLPEGAALVERASVQMGNAQVRLGENLKKASNWAGAILALERGLNYYDDSGAGEKLAADARNNRKRAEILLEECLMSAGAAYEAMAEKAATRPEVEEQELRKALQAFERAAEINPKNPEAPKKATEIREKLAQNLAKQAAEISKKADAAEAAKTKKPEEVLAPRSQAVAKLDEALAFSPGNAPIEEQRKAEQNKISDFLTAQAEKMAAPLMEKPKLEVRDQNTLSQAISNLDQALALNPENQKAQDLSSKAKAKLEQSHVETGQAALANIDRPSASPQARLNQANMAVDQFQKALAMNAENKPAQEGLKQAQDRLPEMYAGVGEAEAAKGEEAMKGQTPPGKAEAAKPSAQNLQKAIGHLEKADQNYSMAASFAPPGPELQKRAEEVRAMLTSARDQLDQQSRDKMKENGKGEGEEVAQGNETQPGEANEEANNTTQQLRSMSDLAARAKPNTGDNFWEKKIRDW